MADPTTPNVLLAVPTRGSDPGTWDVPINADTSANDGFFGGVQTISVSNAPIVLTSPAGVVTPSGGPTQAQNAVLRFTGTLTSSVQVTLPLPGYHIIENLTTGPWVLQFKALGSGQLIATEQGTIQHIYNDGVNVKFVNLPPVGSYLDICDGTMPLWLAGCTIPPYLNCDGEAFSAVTYPYLAAKLGQTSTPDIRGTSRATLNQGTGRITSSGSGIDGNTRFTVGGSEFVGKHTHNGGGTTGLELQSHSHNYQLPVNSAGETGGGAFPAQAGAFVAATTGSENQNHNHSYSFTTDTGTTAGNYQNMPPTTIIGLTLIRAA